ncbi:hypothetical protein P154DRAFT_584488 [Amniculicola lignicola CBS 123094]|uniref:NAD(P)-binding protein n=1 Tax=Amniculicola lignicola CBS 123094 TaxID=1392246 RepID=A0A6A5X4W7_9PLEO|nr:hypothetical protein P154DRAFT_584488 [Amniculicola lignicola CBS 123094]
MVPLSEIIASNKQISSTFQNGLVAVFAGGTSGVYIVGRSQGDASRIIKECKLLNSAGEYELIAADVSLLKSVDEVCRQIKNKETAINILFETQGSMGFKAKTSEGLPYVQSLTQHSRMSFILNLLPLLQRAEDLRRVWRNQSASVATILLEETARRAPNVSFVHTVPGVVKSGIQRDLDAEGFGMRLKIGIANLLMPLIQTLPVECGEGHVFFATSASYPSSHDGSKAAGVPLERNREVARGSNGKNGSGVYSMNNRNESASLRVEGLLAGFREDGTATKVWAHFAADIERVTGAEVAL